MNEDMSPRMVGAVNTIMCLSRQERVELLEYLRRRETGNAAFAVTGFEKLCGISSDLTNRQQEVLTLVANGYTRSEISSTLGISNNTVASHISNIYGKLNISSKTDATIIAFFLGLLVVPKSIALFANRY